MKLVLENDQKLFFTSDTHFGHSNICSATTNWSVNDGYARTFDSLDDMNQTLVDNINNTVGENDVLIHLGDWSFGGFDNIRKFREQLNCKNIHIILGNHDHHIEKNRDNIQELFASVHSYLELDLRRYPNKAQVIKNRFILMHFPITSWKDMNRGMIHLHGHTHLPPHHRVAQGRAMDVGVEGNGLKPIQLEEVLELMKGRPVANLVLPKDHHTKEV